LKRRDFVGALPGSLIAASLLARSQPAGKPARIGILDPGIPHLFAAFRESMRLLGYAEGRDVEYEVRTADGNPNEVPALAVELVRQKPDVIVTAATLPSHALMRETTGIPVVVAAIGDAVAAGIVRNLAQPQGNITGLTFLNTELSAKRLELLREALPRLRRVAVLNDLNSQVSYREQTEKAARQLGLQLQRIDIRAASEFEGAFQDAGRGGAEAVDVLASPFFNANRARLVELALKYRVPAIYESREYAEAGGLMTYGQDLAVLFRRAATYVDKILKGAKPSDLPWEQPTKFELVINLKTAKLLALTIPQSLLVRADDVIR
jgi:putative tryptophan/tyrosine transport system substrate-binding protein